MVNKVLKAAAAKGRGGDDMIAHIGPKDRAILTAMGASGTINPKTGLREYKFDSGGPGGSGGRSGGPSGGNGAGGGGNRSGGTSTGPGSAPGRGPGGTGTGDGSGREGPGGSSRAGGFGPGMGGGNKTGGGGNKDGTVDSRQGVVTPSGFGPKNVASVAESNVTSLGAKKEMDNSEGGLAGWGRRFLHNLMNPTQDQTFNGALSGWGAVMPGLNAALGLTAGLRATFGEGSAPSTNDDNGRGGQSDVTTRRAATATDAAATDPLTADPVDPINQNYSDVRLKDRRAAAPSGGAAGALSSPGAGGLSDQMGDSLNATSALTMPAARYVPRKRLIGMTM